MTLTGLLKSTRHHHRPPPPKKLEEVVKLTAEMVKRLYTIGTTFGVTRDEVKEVAAKLGEKAGFEPITSAKDIPSELYDETVLNVAKRGLMNFTLKLHTNKREAMAMAACVLNLKLGLEIPDGSSALPKMLLQIDELPKLELARKALEDKLKEELAKDDEATQ